MVKAVFGNHSVEWLDDKNYVLLKHGKNEETGEATETRLGYFNKLGSGIKELAKREADHAEDLKEWLSCYAEVVASVDLIDTAAEKNSSKSVF